MPHNFFVSAFTNTLHYQKRKKDKVTKNANDVSVTFFALLEILMKSVLPHHAHINQKMNDNSNNIVLLRSRSAAEEKKSRTTTTLAVRSIKPHPTLNISKTTPPCQIYLYRCLVHCILCSDGFDTYI